MTGLLAALVVVAGGIAALLLVGLGIWFQISRLGRPLTACADLRTSPGKHLGLSPASTASVSPSRWQGSGKLALPGQAR
jgi:hypothetical protein